MCLLWIKMVVDQKYLLSVLSIQIQIFRHTVSLFDHVDYLVDGDSYICISEIHQIVCHSSKSILDKHPVLHKYVQHIHDNEYHHHHHHGYCQRQHCCIIFLWVPNWRCSELILHCKIPAREDILTP